MSRPRGCVKKVPILTAEARCSPGPGPWPFISVHLSRRGNFQVVDWSFCGRRATPKRHITQIEKRGVTCMRSGHDLQGDMEN
jgi:hypothetical protein